MTRRTLPRRPPARRPLRILAVATFLSLLGPGFGPRSNRNGVQAYVTSGLPAHTHKAFLRRLTDDLITSDPGTLAPREVDNAAALMAAWADTLERPRTKRKRHPGSSQGNAHGNLKGWSTIGSGRERALAAEALLKRVIDERRAGNDGAVARTEHYNAVLRSWATSGEGTAAAQRVEEILTNMQRLYEAGDLDVQPNMESFQTAIDAWANATSDDPKALVHAQRILDWMTKLYLSSANDLAAPHISCLHPILKCWAASGKLEAPVISEHLVMWMQNLQTKQGIQSAGPDTKCFNIIMSCWLKSRDTNTNPEKRIRELFDYTEACQKHGSDIKPDASTYNLVITSIAPAVKKYHDADGARRADEMLARMEAGFLAGDESLKPDTIVYNQVIDYWAKAQSVRGHFLRARDVLDRQIELYSNGGVRKCRPDTLSYTSVIAACASTYGGRREKRRAFDVAHETFVEGCKTRYARPNDVTYGLMFKAAGRLLLRERERDRYVKTLFGLCIDDGCLGEMAFYRIKEATTNKLLQELTAGRDYDDFPEEWKRNVGGQQQKSPQGREVRRRVGLRP
ncbi:hypothetical protein ACHAWF_008134 [Thalassiosira exigua]